jgi:flagellar FliL protein
MAEKNETTGNENETKSGGSKKMLIVIILVVVLILAAGGGVAAFLLLGKKDQPANAENDLAQAVPVPEISQPTEVGPMLDIKEFIVNIIAEDNNHYVKAAITLEMTNEAVLEEANSRIPQIRDSILLLVGNKTYEELSDLQGKKQLKAELISKINGFLQSGKVRAIYFTDFVVQ